MQLASRVLGAASEAACCIMQVGHSWEVPASIQLITISPPLVPLMPLAADMLPYWTAPISAALGLSPRGLWEPSLNLHYMQRHARKVGIEDRPILCVADAHKIL